MRMLTCLFLLLPTLAIAAPAIEIESPTARPTYGQTKVGAAYLLIRNDQENDDELMGADSPMAARIELHTTETKSDIMRMRRIEALPVPAHGQAELRPGGAHLMLFTLREPLVAGMHFPVILHFQQAGNIAANFVVY